MPTDAYSLEKRSPMPVPPLAVDVPLGFASASGTTTSTRKKRPGHPGLGTRVTHRMRSAPMRSTSGCSTVQRTVDKVLAHLYTNGLRGRLPGRPAREDDPVRQEPGPRRLHRRTIRRQLPALPGRVRANHHAQSRLRKPLIDDFKPGEVPTLSRSRSTCSTPESDVPEVGNLVFFKQVRSKTKFWQMVGAAHARRRTCLARGEDKEVLLHLRLLRKPAVLRRRCPRHRRVDGTPTVRAAL